MTNIAQPTLVDKRERRDSECTRNMVTSLAQS